MSYYINEELVRFSNDIENAISGNYLEKRLMPYLTSLLSCSSEYKAKKIAEDMKGIATEEYLKLFRKGNSAQRVVTACHKYIELICPTPKEPICSSCHQRRAMSRSPLCCECYMTYSKNKEILEGGNCPTVCRAHRPRCKVVCCVNRDCLEAYNRYSQAQRRPIPFSEWRTCRPCCRNQCD